MTLRELLPTECVTTTNNILTDTQKVLTTALPLGAEETKAYCARLSSLLLNDPRTKPYPELAAFGFWLRAASIDQMLQDLLYAPQGSIRVPLGTVLQIPPSNVDTLFGYTSTISLLCGNVTIVRLSNSKRLLQELLITLIREAMEIAPANLRDRLVIVRYDHDDSITKGLSQACSLRMVWGGDATVLNIRAISLSPLARDMSFSDRFSSCNLNATTYLTVTEQERNDLVAKFANDLYQFDQRACSSPRLLIWTGSASDVSRASDDFYRRLADHPISQNYNVDASVSLAKLLNSYLALLDLPVTNWHVHSPALTTMVINDLAQLSPFKKVGYGFGHLITTRLDKLADLIQYIEDCDQTISLWGFDAETTQSFVSTCNGKGYVRITPVGQAISFDAVWDGVNLFNAMTKLVRVTL